ncbi:MAG TPA: hypothetical protein VG147_12875 [Solirubrobacteraceae bacterium]|jgi:hypothetical protein|nr:hypothetical protein [Solirubrobacteraceae bacterium]
MPLLIEGGATAEAPLMRYPHEGEAMRVMDFQTLGPAYRQRLWLVDAKPMRRRAAARAFAQRVESIEEVREVWVLDTDEDLEVAVVLDDLDLDCEMRLRASFIEVVCAKLNGREGELFVFAATEEIPSRVREGKRLDST